MCSPARGSGSVPDGVAAGVGAGVLPAGGRRRRGRGGRAPGPARLRGLGLASSPGVRGCVLGGGGGLASCRARRKVFNMAAGAPGPLCGGGVGPERPSPGRPTLQAGAPPCPPGPGPPAVPWAELEEGASSAAGGRGGAAGPAPEPRWWCGGRKCVWGRLGRRTGGGGPGARPRARLRTHPTLGRAARLPREVWAVSVGWGRGRAVGGRVRPEDLRRLHAHFPRPAARGG